ncbi:hypothetical protein [Deinococcus sp.]|uniref:hypothetical protein n=1 Tax=Deinococcus sp. TaxID=47478 RepID=UPI0025E6D364|nr:hypothetical protein [Deinococcus sp.]
MSIILSFLGELFFEFFVCVVMDGLRESLFHRRDQRGPDALRRQRLARRPQGRR